MKGNKEQVFEVIKEMLGFCSSFDTSSLTIKIPHRLYFFTGNDPLGFDAQLEGKAIFINAKPRTKSPKNLGYLKIVLSDRKSNTHELRRLLEKKDTTELQKKDKVLFADYRIIRDILIHLIYFLGPEELILITK